jgi:hypothetical protein
LLKRAAILTYLRSLIHRRGKLMEIKIMPNKKSAKIKDLFEDVFVYEIPVDELSARTGGAASAIEWSKTLEFI